MTPIAFDNSYARDLASASVAWKPVPVARPKWLYFNQALASELGLDPQVLSGDDGAAIFAGNVLPEGAAPIAQAYAGHQFGGFSPQLGDGRAVLLGEVIDRHGRRRDLALKGSGRTPFSRGGDGRAAIGPMLREVLIGEAMHGLGIPTTRALAVVATGEPVYRERVLPGAVLTRVAASHLRVGTLQFFAARGDVENLGRVADYAIARHYPGLAGRPDRYIALLAAVARRQAALIASWMNVGFIHGVMNTDNMTLSGETIDYGPCAFLEAYDPAAVFSSIDTQGRYAYGNQPGIARWNLARLGEALLPLVAGSDDEAAMKQAVDQAMAVIDAFPGWYEAALRTGQRAKLGLGPSSAESEAAAKDGAGGPEPTAPQESPEAAIDRRVDRLLATAIDDEDRRLADDWLDLLKAQRVDFTLAWRRLADAAAGDPSPLQALFPEPPALTPWLERWQARCTFVDGTGGQLDGGNAGKAGKAGGALRSERMRKVNPLVIARNHRVEEALAAASEGDDRAPFEKLLAVLADPFVDLPGRSAYVLPAAPEVTATYQTFCGT